jgi:ABC-type multidrug transport system fused ATPase/permease subunit
MYQLNSFSQLPAQNRTSVKISNKILYIRLYLAWVPERHLFTYPPANCQLAKSLTAHVSRVTVTPMTSSLSLNTHHEPPAPSHTPPTARAAAKQTQSFMSTKSRGFCPFSIVLFTGTAYSYVKHLQSKASKQKIARNITMTSRCRPVVICGPSGVGKGTLIELLQKQFPADKFGVSVCT